MTSKGVTHTGESKYGRCIGNHSLGDVWFGLHGLVFLGQDDPQFTHENRDVTTSHVD